MPVFCGFSRIWVLALALTFVCLSHVTLSLKLPNASVIEANGVRNISGLAAASSEHPGFYAADRFEIEDGEVDQSETVTFANVTSMGSFCPPFQNANMHDLLKRSKEGPVQSQSSAGVRDPRLVYLFIIALPYTGSTGLLSLVSTSPVVSTLCDAGTWACEGTWLLIKDHLMTQKNRWSEYHPPNWGHAIETYEKVWHTDARVKVDKSPPNVAKVRKIADHFSERGEQAAFLFLTRSSCYPSGKPRPDRQLQLLVEALHATGRHPSHVVKYEDLLSDPYKTAEDILQFLPSLESLDPSEFGLSQTPHSRDLSAVDYIAQNGPFANRASTDVFHRNLDVQLGYT